MRKSVKAIHIVDGAFSGEFNEIVWIKKKENTFPFLDLDRRLVECFSRVPDGVTVEYEIICGTVNWKIIEKPVELTRELEQKILSDLNEVFSPSTTLPSK